LEFIIAFDVQHIMPIASLTEFTNLLRFSLKPYTKAKCKVSLLILPCTN